MKIVIFEVEEWERDTFKELEDKFTVQFLEEPLSLKNAGAYKDADIISTFIYSSLDSDVLKHFDNVRLIATRSTGFDHIDTDYCVEKGIKVANVPTYGDNTVAEHVFGLILSISHNLIEAVDRTRRGDFTLQGLRGFDLRYKVLGVIGTGAIGQWVIKIARGFDMEVVAYDIKPDEAIADLLGFCYVDLPKLLSSSDIITLHVPYNKHTHHLISSDEFARMKEGAILINTSRGGIIDTEALMNALADEKIAGAGLDVLPEEPVVREEAELIRSIYRKQHNLETLLADHVLLRLRNVIITPHSAFNTCEAVERILETTLENITAFIQGESKNIVAGE